MWKEGKLKKLEACQEITNIDESFFVWIWWKSNSAQVCLWSINKFPWCSWFINSRKEESPYWAAVYLEIITRAKILCNTVSNMLCNVLWYLHCRCSQQPFHTCPPDITWGRNDLPDWSGDTHFWHQPGRHTCYATWLPTGLGLSENDSECLKLPFGWLGYHIARLGIKEVNTK